MASPNRSNWRVSITPVAVTVCTAAGIGLPVLGMVKSWPLWLTVVCITVPWLALCLVLLTHWRRDARTRRALTAMIASYRDGEFNVGLRDLHDEMSPLVQAHNQLGTTLRAERVALSQRELMLDTVIENTPVAIVLISPGGHIVLGNIAARQMLAGGSRLEGNRLDQVVAGAHPALKDALDAGGDAVFDVGIHDESEIIQLSRRRFHLNGQLHELLLLKQLTAELRRQEVRTWKNLIRIISHELNNSLAPIASLASSSRLLLEREQTQRLPDALRTIEERARHLEEFIRGYARFAKLPEPRREPFLWGDLIRRLQMQMAFGWDERHAEGKPNADTAQLEQAVLNLVKNALESGSDPAAVELQLRKLPNGWRIDVLDRGPGMPAHVMTQALLPFYSTKRGGTGLGLALAREIAEAHGGSLSLANRGPHGLMVSMTLPNSDN